MIPFCEEEAAPQSGRVATSHFPGSNLTSGGPDTKVRGSSCHGFRAQHLPLLPPHTSQRLFPIDSGSEDSGKMSGASVLPSLTAIPNP